MDKINSIINHYITLFDNRLFDEYDVSGFLILIRNDGIEQNQPFIYDFANIVAHRTRTEGVACSAMNAAIKNNCRTNSKKKVIGFNGPSYNTLVKEIKILSYKYGFNAENDFCKDFILCLMSIAQNVICKTNDEKICELRLAQGRNDTLALIAVGEDVSICYSLYGAKLSFENEYTAGQIPAAVEAIRINGRLELCFCESGAKI